VYQVALNIGALGDFFTPQSRRSPARRWKAERRRIEPRAAIPEIISKQVVV